MKSEIKKLLALYIDVAKKMGIEHKGHTHLSDLGMGAYIPDDYDESYGTIKAFGLEININGEIIIKYEDEIFPIDYEKWLKAVESILYKGEKQEMKIEDFKLDIPENIEIKRSDLFESENRVKAKILDDLIKRNVSFNN